MLREDAGPRDVIVEGDAGKTRRAGIRIHRSLSLNAKEVTLRNGVPITTPARTIADLRLAVAARFPGAPLPRELRRAIRQANVLGLPIDEGDSEDRTRGDLERAFLRLCRRYRLPQPEVNVRIGPHLVDFFWRERGVAVETDHYLHHRGRQAFQDDRGRDLDLKRRGFDVVRLAERQIEKEADQVAAVLRTALGAERR
jgi:very-short-patch-repair endonuclease